MAFPVERGNGQAMKRLWVWMAHDKLVDLTDAGNTKTFRFLNHPHNYLTIL